MQQQPAAPPTPPPPDPGDRVKRLDFNFFTTWSCMQQHGSKYLPAASPPHPHPPSPDPEDRVKGRILTLSEHGHVAYQIKGNQVCSTMVANILLAVPDLALGVGSKGQNSTCSHIVMLHIKLKGITNAATW